MLACLLVSWRAVAEEKPLYLPMRDVTVTYRLTTESPGTTAPPAGREAHMYFSAELNKLRLDEPTQKGYAVIDRASQQVVIVMPQQRAYSVLPFTPEMASGFILNDQMKFSRTGTDTIAGLSCTRWSVEAARAAGTVCVTTDGVLLSGHGRVREGGVSGLEAISVTYSPQPQSLFAPPADFVRLALPIGRAGK